jgi:hypothetical protein
MTDPQTIDAFAPKSRLLCTVAPAFNVGPSAQRPEALLTRAKCHPIR